MTTAYNLPFTVNANPEAPPTLEIIPPTGRPQLTLAGATMRRLLDNDMDIGVLRPWKDERGQTWVTRNHYNHHTGETKSVNVPTNNDTQATLGYLDWLEIDRSVTDAALPELVVAQQFINAGMVYRLPNGIGKTVHQHSRASDIGGAEISMDGRRRSENDRPVFDNVQLPIPLIHKDFSFSWREVLESRTGVTPLDTYTAKLAARKVAEQVEQLLLGSSNSLFFGKSSFTWNGLTVYGMKNWPGRITYSLNPPTAGGWTPDVTIADILNMQKASRQAYHRGPWDYYMGLSWQPYLDSDYKPTYNATTLRQRIQSIGNVSNITLADYLEGYDILEVERNSLTARLVIGMDIVTIQWSSPDGMELYYKVMCCMLPQFFNDIYGNTGLVHAA